MALGSRAAYCCFCVVLVIVSSMLQGCGNDSPSGGLSPTSSRKIVILMRHCVRSTGSDSDPFVNSVSGITATATQLTAIPMPDWGVAEKLCTDEGKRIIEGVGEYVQKVFKPDPSSLLVVADASAQRDVTTSEHLASGMGVPADVIKLNEAVFDSTEFGACDNVVFGAGEEWDTQYHVQNFAETEMPMDIGLPSESNVDFAKNWNAMLARLEGILGTAGQYSVTAALRMDQNNLPTPGNIIIACGVLKFFAQQFLYAYASGITWGITLEPAEIFEWSQWIYYQRHVKYPAEELVTKGLTITHTILTDLKNEGASTTIYVGHDSDIDQVAEIFGGLEWELPDYGVRGTPPGSGFVFINHPGSDDVDIHYMYTKFDGDTTAVDTTHSNVVVSESRQFTWQELNDTYTKKPNDYERAKACKTALDVALSNDDGIFDPAR